MAKNEKGSEKLKILYIRDYLLSASDENHPVSVNDIIRFLEEDHGISAERKSIYRDLKLLGRKDDADDESGDGLISPYGLDIRRKEKKIYIGKREFSLQELKLLIDMVESSSNIPESTARSLVEKLSRHASIHERRNLQRHIGIRNQVKNLNGKFQENADKIFEAIRSNRVLDFQYFRYTFGNSPTGRIRELRRNGKFYTVSPFSLVWVDQNYYMLGFNHEYGEVRAYRVDRMTNVRLKKGPRLGSQEYRKLTGGNLPAFINKVFHMYLGEEKLVTMRFSNSLIDTVIDRFGEKVILIPDGQDHFTLTAEVSVSPQFYGWLAGFGGLAELKAPLSEREKMTAHLHDALSLYGQSPSDSKSDV